jgi:hypothetical protein
MAIERGFRNLHNSEAVTGGTVTGSGSANQVAFWTSATNISGDANFQFNSTNDTLVLKGTAAQSAGAGNALISPVSPTASANYGLISFGSGGFAGGGAPNFSGSASGTYLAVNSAAGFTGDFFNFQVNGVIYSQLNASGRFYISDGTDSFIEVTPSINQYKFGDITNKLNGTHLFIDDPNQIVDIVDSLGFPTARINVFNRSVALGDAIVAGNGTRLVVTPLSNYATVTNTANTVTFGINEAAPLFTLDVGGTAAAGAVGASVANNNTTGVSQYVLSEDSGSANANFYIQRFGSTHATATARRSVEITNADNAYMTFGTNNVERIRLAADGNFAYNTTTTTDAKFRIAGGTLTGSVNALNVSGTLPATGDVQGVRFMITSSGTGVANTAAFASLGAGYSGSGITVGMEVNNLAASTGNDLRFGSSGNNVLGNAGFNAFTTATTTGLNVGGKSEALGGDVNVGLYGKAATLKNSATNIGIIGVGRNTGTTPIQVGGFFSLGNTTPTFVSSALVADNGDQTSPIFLAKDNGTTVASIADGGKFDAVSYSVGGTDGASGTGTVISAITVVNGIITAITVS